VAPGTWTLTLKSVEVPLPVARHTAGRARHRLVERMVLGRCEARTFQGFFGEVVPEPVLAWLEAADNSVARLIGVQGGVLARGRVATADVAAPGAASQVEPPPVGRKALDAAGAARRRCRVDSVIWHVHSLCSRGAAPPAARRTLLGADTPQQVLLLDKP
jgi:hypothetical protein